MLSRLRSIALPASRVLPRMYVKTIVGLPHLLFLPLQSNPLTAHPACGYMSLCLPHPTLLSLPPTLSLSLFLSLPSSLPLSLSLSSLRPPDVEWNGSWVGAERDG
jgi:hypothetical protein